MATTAVDLFRAGNAGSARLDRVRSSDLTIYKIGVVDWVKSGTGGMSTWDAIDPTLNGPWWRLPAGTDYNDIALVLVNDQGNHWSWEPRFDMELAAYQNALAAVNMKFIRV
ncbi:MAG: hypothetical protein ACLQJR_11500 [Stellaceae bacterium]